MTYYKDFSKDIKDLLTKNYTDAGIWKADAKQKGPKDALFANLSGSSQSGLSLDAEYNPSCCGAKVKVTTNPKKDVKVTASYEEKGHKVEVIADQALNYEVSYEGKIAGVAINEKLTSKLLDSGVSYAVAKNCQVGAGATFAIKDSSLKWSLGARYAEAGRLVTLQTNQLQKYLTGVSIPVTVAGKKTTIAAQVECGQNAFAATAGLELPCVLVPGNAVRVRVTDKLSWAVAYIAKLPNNLKAAVTIDGKLNPGVTFTCE